MEDLISALNNLNIQSPFELMKNGLFSADLANVLSTLQTLTHFMDPSHVQNIKDTRDEIVKCY